MNRSAIKISIIIPIYNMEKYIKSSIDSVINQDLDEIEIICINDGSSDNSLFLLNQYREKDERVIIINKKNEGVAKARNLGIQKANGKYVFFLDPDDFLPERNIMSVLYEIAEKNKVMIAGGEFSDFDSKGIVNKKYTGTLKGYSFEKEGIIFYTDYQFDYGYHRFIYNREFLVKNQIFFPELIRFQDPPFMVRAFTIAKKFFAVKKTTYCYRMDYRPIDWNKKRVKDLLIGLRININWAKEYHLDALLSLSIERMVDEYFEVIMAQFLVNQEIRDIVWDIVNENVVKDNEKLLDFNKRLLDYVIKQYEHIKQSKSYKLGCAITCLPRKIRKMFMKVRGKDGFTRN